MPTNNLTISFKANAKAMNAKAMNTLGKRSYAAKMLRKYDLMVNKRIRDKRILLDRKFKDWTLDI